MVLEANFTLYATRTSPLQEDVCQRGFFLSRMPVYAQILSPISKDNKYVHSCTNGRLSSEGPAHIAVKPQCLPDQLNCHSKNHRARGSSPRVTLSLLPFFRETDICWWHLSTCWLPEGGTRMNIFKVDSLSFSLLRLDFPVSASLLHHGNQALDLLFCTHSALLPCTYYTISPPPPPPRWARLLSRSGSDAGVSPSCQGPSTWLLNPSFCFSFLCQVSWESNNPPCSDLFWHFKLLRTPHPQIILAFRSSVFRFRGEPYSFCLNLGTRWFCHKTTLLLRTE